MNYTIKLTTTFLAIIALTFSGFAQKMSYDWGTIERDDQQRPALVVELPTETDETRDGFIDFLKDKYDVKLKGNGFLANKDVLEAKKKKIEAISQKELDYYAKIVESDDEEGTIMHIFAAYGYDIYIGPESSESDAFETVVIRFIKSFVPKRFAERLNNQKETVQEIEKDLNDTADNITEKKSEIENLNQEIKKLQSKTDDLNEKKTEAQQKLDALNRTDQQLKSKMNSAKFMNTKE